MKVYKKKVGLNISLYLFSLPAGKPITLGALLHDKSSTDIAHVLSDYHESEEQKCTALVIASRNGHNTVVKLLLGQYGVNIEQTGTVKFNGYTIEGASALWAAAGAGHFEVVKLLIEHHADVNHATVTNSTPLRSACFDGKLAIVKYLVEHSADIHVPNKYGNTCLMIACYKGHMGVIRYLLEQGADVNSKANCGATALHFAAECGHLDIVKELIMYKAEPVANKQNLTPLMIACENSQAEVAEYLMSLPDVSKEDRIQSLELLGASYANNKDNYNLAKTYHYLYLAMLHRIMDPTDIVKKDIQDAIPAYGNRTEVRTLMELKGIKGDQYALQMEALMIRERILGTDNPDMLHAIVFRGAVCADSMQFVKCVALWLHAMHLRQTMNRSIQKDILRFAQVFSQMLHLREKAQFSDVCEVLKAAVTEVELYQEKLKTCTEAEKPLLQSVFQADILTILYLLSVLTHKNVEKSISEDYTYKKWVYRFLMLDSRTPTGATPLHLVVNHQTPIDDFHTNTVCKFPSIDLVRLFLECGADPDAVDNDNQTALHVIVKYNKPISDFMTLHSIIVLLCEEGCHIDRVNRRGETAIDASTTGVAEIILKAQLRPNLKCMAAKVVRKHRLLYKGMVPVSLEEFIEMH